MPDATHDEPPSARVAFDWVGDYATFERAKIEHEDEVLNHRLSWLATSQAILGTAYILRFNQDPHGASVVPWSVRLMLPVLAFATCVVFYIGIYAALVASNNVRKTWDARGDGFEGLLGSGSGWTWKLGRLPGLVVPPMFMLAWLGALVYEINNQ